MAYSIQFGDDIKAYLWGKLSRAGLVKVYAGLDTYLRDNGDRLISDPARKITDSPLRFWYHLIFIDPQQGNNIRSFWFIVNAESARFGVLQVEYVEEGNPPPSFF